MIWNGEREKTHKTEMDCVVMVLQSERCLGVSALWSARDSIGESDALSRIARGASSSSPACSGVNTADAPHDEGNISEPGLPYKCEKQ